MVGVLGGWLVRKGGGVGKGGGRGIQGEGK